jgi:hypothetical protein
VFTRSAPRLVHSLASKIWLIVAEIEFHQVIRECEAPGLGALFVRRGERSRPRFIIARDPLSRCDVTPPCSAGLGCEEGGQVVGLSHPGRCVLTPQRD